MENINLVNVVFAAAGFAVSTVIWWIMYNLMKMGLRRSIRMEMYADLPTNIEDIERSRNLERSYHQVELKQLELRIAEMKRDVAESEAKVSESLGRISELNHKVELMMLERKAYKMVYEEQLVAEQYGSTNSKPSKSRPKKEKEIASLETNVVN
jgi:septal ring factor EnvC (AmiA/AmiB activator)